MTTKGQYVHMQDAEMQALDAMQGGPEYDDDGAREYSKLGELAQIPQVRDVFTHMISYLHKNNGHIPENEQKEAEEFFKSVPKVHKSNEERMNPFLMELARKGTHGDNDIAWLPNNLVKIFIKIKGEPKENPHTGLLMFGFWKSMKKAFRWIAPVVGAIAGNVVLPGIGGVLAGSALGSAGSRAATGQTGSKLWHGVLGDTGKVGLGHAALGMFPGVANAASSFLPTSLANHIGSLSSTSPLASSMSAQAPLMGEAGKAAAGQAAAQTAAQPSSMVSSLMNPNLLGPLIVGGQGLMSYSADKAREKERRKYLDEKRNRFEQKHAYLDEPFGNIEARKRVKNPAFYDLSDEDKKYGIYPEPFFEEPSKYKKGGKAHGMHHSVDMPNIPMNELLRGPGKGQDDLIKTRVPENSYITNATSTSDAGDGDSEAGSKVWKVFIDEHKKKYGHLVKPQSTRMIDVYLSRGEMPIDPFGVAALGRGDNDKGAKILKTITQNMRRQKSSNGDKLPPKAKPLNFYIDSYRKGRG